MWTSMLQMGEKDVYGFPIKCIRLSMKNTFLHCMLNDMASCQLSTPTR